jgi:hypothetical protein
VSPFAVQAVPRPENQGPSARLQAWFSGPVGKRLLAAEREQLVKVVAPLRGKVAVQVGDPGWGKPLLEGGFSYHARVAVSSRDDAGWADALARPDALPLLPDSVDALLLPHVLEFVPAPTAVLKEAQRVVAGEGSLLVVGFEPWGALGGWRLLRGFGGKYPWSGRFIGASRLSGWLADLGFEVMEVRGCSPLRWLSCRRFGCGVGAPRCLFCGLAAPYQGAYVLAAKRHCIPLTPIRPSWKANRLLPGGLAEPTASRTP